MVRKMMYLLLNSHRVPLPRARGLLIDQESPVLNRAYRMLYRRRVKSGVTTQVTTAHIDLRDCHASHKAVTTQKTGMGACSPLRVEPQVYHRLESCNENIPSFRTPEPR